MSRPHSSAWTTVSCVLALFSTVTVAAEPAAWTRVWNTGNAPVQRLAVAGGRAYAWASAPLNVIGRSTGGDSWSESIGTDRVDIKAIRFDPHSPDRVWVAATSAKPGRTGVLRSDDAGATFQSLPVPVHDGHVEDLAVLANGNIVIGASPASYPSSLNGLTSPGGVYESSSAGASWTSAGLQGLQVDSFHLDAYDPETIYARAVGESHRNTMYRSTGDRLMWQQFFPGRLWYVHVDPHDRHRIMARAEALMWDFLVRSDDGGSSWRIQWTPPLIDESSESKPVIITALVPDPLSPGVLYIGTLLHGVHRSTNDGATWEPIGLENISINELAIDSTTGFLYAATAPRSGLANAGVYRLTNPSGDPTLLPWFTMDRDTVPLGIPITFMDDTRGTVVTRMWDFGDGTSSAEAAPMHTYARGGTFSVALTVSDAAETKSIRRTVVVEPTRARPVRRGNASIEGSADTAVPSTDLIN